MALTFDDEQAQALLTPLGLPTTTTDIDTVVLAVADALSVDLGTAAPSAIAAAAAKAGLEVVDADTLKTMRQDLAEARTFKAGVEKERIEAAVNTAISKGKITPGRKEHWVNLITADPGMGEVLASVPDETAIPMTPIGHNISNEDGRAPQSDEWFY